MLKIHQRQVDLTLHHPMDVYMHHIFINNQHDMSSVYGFYIAGHLMGYISHVLYEKLSTLYPQAFVKRGDVLVLSEEFSTFEARTDFFDHVIQHLLRLELIEAPRDEYYAVAPDFGLTPVCKIKRGTSAYFGFKNYGVHLNGYVREGDKLLMWVAERSAQKSVAPHKWDQMVAGGLPYGLSVEANLYKEAQEEANLESPILDQAKSVGTLRYMRQSAMKLRRDTVFVYDIELPPSFEPKNQDGEVEKFMLLPMSDVIDALAEPDKFKFNSALVVIDFMIRHGVITPDEPGYTKLVQQLQTGRS